MTKERPILFSAPMVRAILDGRKTQTRRIVKPQPNEFIDRLHGGSLKKRFPYKLEDDDGNPCGIGFQDDNGNYWTCPYGQPGDVLWVRETWIAPYVKTEIARYKADEPEGCLPRKWKPSIFMPRWASRISLRVTSVRVERLNDISQTDAIAEGVSGVNTGDFVTAYSELWESINGTDSWQANPWVWVIEFERVKPL